MNSFGAAAWFTIPPPWDPVRMRRAHERHRQCHESLHRPEPGRPKVDRVLPSSIPPNKLVVLYAVIILVVLETCNEPIIRFFLGDRASAVALETGTSFLKFVGFFISIIGFKMAVDGVLRGAGGYEAVHHRQSDQPGPADPDFPHPGPLYGIQMVWMAEPVGWSANWLISHYEYRSMRWIHKVKIG